jgi:hypothetical protein
MIEKIRKRIGSNQSGLKDLMWKILQYEEKNHEHQSDTIFTIFMNVYKNDVICSNSLQEDYI